MEAPARKARVPPVLSVDPTVAPPACIPRSFPAVLEVVCLSIQIIREVLPPKDKALVGVVTPIPTLPAI